MTSRPTQITERHLARWAVAYSRVSSQEQKERNVGSIAIQQDLVLKLEAWGWPQTLIRLVDVDLGVSGSRPGAREGFSELLEQMKADEIGVVAVVDSSRLSRNFRDLVQFVEAAQEHDVLLVQAGLVIDFNDPNSFFIGGVLGLNAVRENQARAQLSVQARRKKAEKGIAPTAPPVGYVRRPDGVWLKDPDPNVREVINLIFDKFQEIGTIRGVVRYLRTQGILIPRRPWTDRRRPWKVRSRGQEATYDNIAGFLQNPVYAGRYTYGQTVEERGSKGSLKRGCQRRQPMSEWIIKPNHHEPYVDPSRWPEIEQQIAANRSIVRPPAGRGEGLVQGLLWCTLHQRMFLTVHSDRHPHADGRIERRARYFCGPSSKEEAPRWPSHLSVMAPRMDAVIERVLLQTITPLALDGIQEAVCEERREHDVLERRRQDEVRRLQQAFADAERAYLQADPAHLPFRAHLSERSNNALQQLKSVEAYNRLHPLIPPLTLDEGTLSELRKLLSDLPRLWRHPRVTRQQRKAIVRMVIKKIHVTPGLETWPLEIEWISGARTVLELTRQDRARILPTSQPPRKRAIDLLAFAFIRDRVADGAPTPAIAEALNAEGFHHPRAPWTAMRVKVAIDRIRRGEIPGVEPPPHRPTLTDRVRALHKEGRSVSGMVAQLRAQNIKTRDATVVTRDAVSKALQRCGLSAHSVLMDERVRAELREWGPRLTPAEMAVRLNAAGLKTMTGRPWTPDNVREKLRNLANTFLRLRDASRPEFQTGPGHTVSADGSG